MGRNVFTYTHTYIYIYTFVWSCLCNLYSFTLKYNITWPQIPIIFFLYSRPMLVFWYVSIDSLQTLQGSNTVVRLTHWGRDKMAAVSQTTLSNPFFNENNRISIKISPKFPTLVHLMAWCRPGDKPSSEPKMVSSTTHICVSRPQWVKVRLKSYHAGFFLTMSFWYHSSIESCVPSIWSNS